MVFHGFYLFYRKQIPENGHDQMNELETLFLKILASIITNLIHHSELCKKKNQYWI
jgi:hypothetical protein